jgi:hypothetical protein
MRRSLNLLVVCAFRLAPLAPLATAACGGSTSATGSQDAAADAVGSTQDASTDAVSSEGGSTGTCTSGGIAFDLSIDSTGPVFLGGSQPPWPTSLGCPGWLTITNPAGQPIVVSKGDCFVGCVAAQAEPEGPQSFSWDGTYYPVAADCQGGGPNCSCTTPACAPAGTYTATFCIGYASPDGGLPEIDPPTCKQVSFVWPPSGDISTINETITPTPDGG